MRTNLYLFLDFDGILRPEGVGPELEFCHLQSFESLMRQYPQVWLVWSSSWRLHSPTRRGQSITSQVTLQRSLLPAHS
ncbi:HAD domain-containing protein [Curvibacter fontanus]